jgi:hypothetical protein
MNISYAHINAYIKGTLPRDLESQIEELAQKETSIAKMIEEKKDEQTLIQSLIPSHKSDSRSLKTIQADLELITDEILVEEKTNILDKVAKVLDTTILEF